MRVCVIGAGVVGVTSAYFLARQGMTWCWSTASRVLRKFPVTPTAASSATATSRRWPAGVLPSVPGWLLRSDSPLRFRPRLDPHQWRWCLQFALACRASVARASTAELLTLSYLSRDAMHAAGPGEPGFRPSEERQAHRLPQRRAAGQGARAGRLPGRAWRRPAGAGRRPDPGAGAGPGRHGRQPGGRDLYAQRRGGRLPPVHRGIVRPPAGHGQRAMRDVQSGLGPAAGRPPRRGGAEPRRRHRRGRGGAGDRHRHARAALAAGPRRAALSAQGLQPDRAAGRRRPHGARHQRH